MKTPLHIFNANRAAVSMVYAVVVLTSAAFQLSAATFNSGSDGSFGNINVAQSATLVVDVPADGVLKVGTITIPCAATLAFRAGAFLNQ